jgi:hypothetical protein
MRGPDRNDAADLCRIGSGHDALVQRFRASLATLSRNGRGNSHEEAGKWR